MDCKNQYHSKRISRDKNVNWQGGISEDLYDGLFNERLKKEIRKRDKYKCLKCGNKGIDVHHIDKEKMNSDKSNLITLCHTCHLKYHGRTQGKKYKNYSYIDWSEDFWNWVGLRVDTVVSKRSLKYKLPVYNLEIEDNNNYFANGVLVHNCDETAEIPDDAYSKIYRMLVEKPDMILLEIGNPWFLNHFHQHHSDDGWTKFHVNWRDCVKEGRMTQEAIDDQRRELTELEFLVLFEAEFPQELEYSIFSNEAIENSQRLKQQDEFDKYLIGVDVARGGRDITVITVLGKKESDILYLEHLAIDTNNTMEVVGQVCEICSKYGIDNSEIVVDTVGLGAGVYDRLNELHYKVFPFVAGNKARQDEKYYNLKSEVVFNTAELMKSGRFYNLPPSSKYILQLRSWIYEIKSDRKRKVIDPEKSPDYADSLIMALYKIIYPEFTRMKSFENVYKNRYTGKPIERGMFRSKSRRR